MDNDGVLCTTHVSNGRGLQLQKNLTVRVQIFAVLAIASIASSVFNPIDVFGQRNNSMRR